MSITLDQYTWVFKQFRKYINESYKYNVDVIGENIDKLEKSDFKYMYALYKGQDIGGLVIELKKLIK